MLRLLCLVLSAQAFTQEGFKEVVLKQLGLSEVPKVHKRDLVDLVIPDHVKNKYMSMLKRQRVKRRALPSLAGILRGIPGHTGNVSAAGSIPSALLPPGKPARALPAGRSMGRGKSPRGKGNEGRLWLQNSAGQKRCVQQHLRDQQALLAPGEGIPQSFLRTGCCWSLIEALVPWEQSGQVGGGKNVQAT